MERQGCVSSGFSQLRVRRAGKLGIAGIKECHDWGNLGGGT